MLLNFYVKGQPPGSHSTSTDESYVDSAIRWTQDTSSTFLEMTPNEILDAAKERLDRLSENFKQMFRFLSGDSVPTPRGMPTSSPDVKEEKQEKGWISSLTGVFSGIKGASVAHTEHFEDPAGPVDTEGEVHADLVMVGLLCISLSLSC